MGPKIHKVFEKGPETFGQGEIIYSFSHDMSFIAACGESKNVKVFDRRGGLFKEVQLNSTNKVLALEWDKDNEILAILQDNLSYIQLWHVFTKDETMEIELSQKEVASFIKWSSTHPVLVIGTSRGGLLFYSKKNQKKLPTVGKHSKKVIDGDWSPDGLLITISEDKTQTVSNHTSETVYDQGSLKQDAKNVRWTKLRTEDRNADAKQRTISAIMNNRSQLLFNLNSTNQPLQLQFEPKYGKIVDYSLFGDGYIVIGFSSGYLSHVSAHTKEINEEQVSERVFQTTLEAICSNEFQNKCAVAGEGTVKIFNMQTWKEIKKERISLPNNIGKVSKISWSTNGQLLAIASTGGYLYGMLTHLPRLYSCYLNSVAILTSFTEITVQRTEDYSTGNVISKMNLEIEPGFIGIGPNHIVSGMNSYAYIYRYCAPDGTDYTETVLERKTDYFARILRVCLNKSYIAVLTEVNCYLQTIETDEDTFYERRYPENENEKKIDQIYLSENFLTMLDSANRIIIFCLESRKVIYEHKPDYQILKFFPNHNATKIVFIDKEAKGILFNCISEESIEIKEFSKKITEIIWDLFEPNLFCGLDVDTVYTFLYNRKFYKGDCCYAVPEILSIENVDNTDEICLTKIDKGLSPMIQANGFQCCMNASNEFTGNWLSSHSYNSFYEDDQEDTEGNLRFFFQNLSINKFKDCLKACNNLQLDELYEILAKKALENLDLEVSMKAYQKNNNISMVYSLSQMKHIEEKKILQGFVAMILCDYALAQELFMKSTNRKLALEQRCDIQDWGTALSISENLAQDRVPMIRRKLAEQQERASNNQQAQKQFERSQVDNSLSSAAEKRKHAKHNMLCMAGIARTAIKTGNVSRGYAIATEIQDKDAVNEIAFSCEQMKQFDEAATLYEKGQNYEKAAQLYIQLKEFKKAEALMKYITKTSILMSLAKMKETEGNFKEAEFAYERANEYEQVIRLNLERLNNYEKAYALFTDKSPTQSCASLLAEYCERQDMKKEAIGFQVHAGKKSDAFNKAQIYGEMEAYADSLEEITPQESLKIAQFYEGKDDYKRAGKYYETSGQYNNSLKCYMAAGDELIENAIEMVSKSQNEILFDKLMEYLEGDDQHDPKDPKYAFKLYLTFGKIEPAVRMALFIVQKEQEDGNYTEAHQILFNLLNEMIDRKVKVSYELLQKMTIIHSYSIVNKLIKMGENENAARMLNRVCANISQFPRHAGTILTIAVKECVQSGQKASAYTWAAQLCRPEYKSQIKEQHRRKIENTARRPIKEEPAEATSPCPFCRNPVPESELNCPACLNNLPMCIITGKHMTLDGVAKCPKCSSPAFEELFKKMIELDPKCPMCHEKLDPSEVNNDIPNVQTFLRERIIDSMGKEVDEKK